MSLPPGQRDFGSFPRFGIALWEPPRPAAQPALIRVAGAVARPLEVPVARLAELPRRDLVADFHCVTGWSVPGLHWGGVAFRTFYESVIVPEAGPEPGVSHVLFEGADGFRATLALEDALDADVLLADQLGGAALACDHGAPVRLLSPKQYAYKSAKHLCRIELHTREPADGYRKGVRRRFLKRLVTPHPRARVAEEERHRYLPAWVVRGIYRNVLRPFWLWAFPGRRPSWEEKGTA
jgi:DMSO/TMAO reductase YedYZ molybdopterin-dependent catalytic subunit